MSNYEYVNKLLKQCQIMFLQETWLKTAKQAKIVLDNNFRFIHKSSIKPGCKKGRPHGGIGWLINKGKIGLNAKVKFISERLSTCSIGDTIIIGVYMNYNDNSTIAIMEHERLITQVLNQIDLAIDEEKNKKVIVLGDFNSDLNRETEFDSILKAAIESYDLTCVDHLYTQSIDYTYRNKNKKSRIDHIFINKHADKTTIQANIQHGKNHFDNLSDHLAITIDTMIELNEHKKEKKNKKPKMEWLNQDFITLYRIKLEKTLGDINLIELKNASRHNAITIMSKIINELNSALRESAIQVAYSVKPINKHIKSKVWWDGELSIIRHELRRLYVEWKRTNAYEDEIRFFEEKKKFRKKIKQKKRKSEENIIKKVNRLYYANKMEFWKEMETIRGDEPTPDIEINKLKSSYVKLFNERQMEFDETEETRIKQEIIKYEEQIAKQQKSLVIDRSVIKKIIGKLPNQKAMGFSETSNEMLKYGCIETLSNIIATVFETMISMKIVPYFFNIGKIKPLIKNKTENLSDINNIRPITISDTIANIFEKYILHEIEKENKEPEMQFAFKKNSSVNHAVYLVDETIKYYKKKNKTVYICAIDASKAFDKINRLKLLYKLIGKIDAELWQILKLYYDNSVVYIQSQEKMSPIFKTTVGVKQGGPLSPKLFSIYTEDLIKEISEAKLTTELHGINTGVIMYADDLLIMTDSLEKMKKALKICEEFGKINEIKYNPKKTQIMATNGKNMRKENIKLCNEEIEWVNKLKYLGIWINQKNNNKDHLQERRIKAWASYHKLKNDIDIENKKMSLNLKIHLFKSYIRPIIYYGLENLHLTKTELRKIQTMEAIMVKSMIGYKKRTRTTNLLHAIGIEPVARKYKIMRLNFMKRLLGNEYTFKIVKTIERENENNKYVKETKEYIGGEIEWDKIKEIIKREKLKNEEESKNGISDSIRTCLRINNEKLIKLLIKSY